MRADSAGPPIDPPATGIAYGPVHQSDGSDGQVDTDVVLGDRPPDRGELRIKEKRTWRTWQLVAVALLAALLGMWINGSTGGASETSAGSRESKLPPASKSAGSPSSASSSSTSTSAPGSSSTTTTTGSGAVTTTTTAAGGAPTPAAGPNTVLIPATQLTGNWTSPAFNIAGGTWNIGWAFQCSPVPISTPSFAVFVVNNGASPGPTPAVSSSAPQGQSVTPQTSTGSQQIVVQAPAGCRWVVKVTGYSG